MAVIITEKEGGVTFLVRVVPRSSKSEIVGEHDAVLEFLVQIDGVSVNGVDMIKWDDEGKIVEFKVMLRPLKAINLVHLKMAAMLQQMQ